MSADNRICVMDCGPNGWAVWHGSGSSNYHEPPSNAEWFGSIEEARVGVWDMEKRIDYLEYGIGFIEKEEQEKALAEEIDYLQTRLDRLRKYGRQWREDGDDADGFFQTDAEKVEILRAALDDIHTSAHCIAKSGPVTTPDLSTAWGKFMEIGAKAGHALYRTRERKETESH